MPVGVAKLIAGLPLPAFAEGRYLDVLASNRLAVALLPRLQVGGNRLRDVFLDPAERAMFPDGDRAAAGLLAGFGQSVGTDIDDPRFIELVGELSLASDDFRRPWARHDIGVRAGAAELVLNREKLVVGGSESLMLVIYHADTGSDAAEKLALLGSASLPAASGLDRNPSQSSTRSSPRQRERKSGE